MEEVEPTKRLSRDYDRLDTYLLNLSQDVYAQPPDEGHAVWAASTVEAMIGITPLAKNVLDIGCGQGFMQPLFEDLGLKWTGLTLGEDYAICKRNGLNVVHCDMTFTPFRNREFDLLFARHVLEHSPFPVITLMEWNRICGGWLLLVAPCPAYWGVRGKNHYSMIWFEHLEWLLARAGWRPIHTFDFKTSDELFKRYARYPANDPVKIVEYRILCERIKPEVE